MKVEIKGVGTLNKGAYLMLLSIIQEFKSRETNAEFCAQLGFGMDKDVLNKYNFNEKINLYGKRNKLFNFYKPFIPNFIRSKELILDRDLDVIIDGSGFAYSDYWGVEKISSRLHEVISRKISNKTKLILLPQALGPFTDKKIIDCFKIVVDRADLIIARDKVSYNNLISTYGEKDKFKLFPDFTNKLNSGEVTVYSEGDICIIPNYKMIVGESDNYYRFLETTIKHLVEKQEKFYFLIHEGEKDLLIANNICRNLKISIPIVTESDPILIKNRIKSSKLIVVSRFHGLVSALCQGIPVISTSWSHKYQMLLEDYNQGDSFIDINNNNDDMLRNMIDEKLALDIIEYQNSQKGIVQKEYDKTDEMWNLVFGLMMKSNKN